MIMSMIIFTPFQPEYGIKIHLVLLDSVKVSSVYYKKKRSFMKKTLQSITKDVHRKNVSSCSHCTPFGVSQVVCDAHLRLLAPWATRLLSQ